LCIRLPTLSVSCFDYGTQDCIIFPIRLGQMLITIHNL
jgi:hypothetical protein